MEAPKRRRRKGSGSEYIDPQGRFVIEKKVLNGEGHKSQVRGYGASWSEAQTRFNRNYERFLEGGGKKPSQKTLSAVLSAWDASSGSGSQTKYRTRLTVKNHYIEPFGDHKVSEITKAKIQRAIDRIPIEQGGARRNFLKDMKKILNHAMKQGWIKTNPAEHLSLGVYQPQKQETDAREMTVRVAEFRKLLKWLQDADRWEFYPLMFLSLGLRISEFLGMEWSSVQSRPNDITVLIVDRQLDPSPYKIVKRVKGSYNREIHLPSSFVVAFVEWQMHTRVQGDAVQSWAKNQVFTKLNYQGQKHGQTQDDFRKLLKSLLEEHHRVSMIPEYGEGVKPVEFTPHYIRKMAATMMAQEGIGLQVAKQVLGHMTEEMTESYTHILDGQKTEATAALEKGFFNYK